MSPRTAARFKLGAAGILGGAALIAAVTVVARVVGFGRWLVFSRTVTDSCLGTAYSTANMLPNIVFEVVAGGALASAVVPLLGAQLARGDAESLRRTASALLTWTLLALLPLAGLGVLLAGPLMSALTGDPRGCSADGGAAGAAAAATRMFVLFAPQIPLYGVAVVCGGILNAHRRYLAPAAAPLVSSTVVVTTYLAFGLGSPGDPDELATVPRGWQLFLAAGTTAGVLALLLALVLPVRRLHLHLRPTLHFPAGVAGQARGLALAGVSGLVAQQLAVLVAIILANRAGGGGALVVYNYAWAVYLLPWAVLAVPVATTAFTALSEHAGRGELDAFARTTARTTCAVALASLLGAALLAGTAEPVSRAFLAGDAGGAPSWQLGWALVAFAPGLVAYGLVAHLGRVLYARDRGRPAATAVVSGWLLVTGASIPIVLAVPAGWTVTAIAAATTLGMILAAALLLAATGRAAGRASLAGVRRVLAAGAVGACAGGGVAATLAGVPTLHGLLANGALAAGAAIVAATVFAAVTLLLGGPRLRALLPDLRPVLTGRHRPAP